jgi:hypothetical protein
MYSTTTGASAADTCTSCLPNSQSISGSSLQTNCQCNAGYTGAVGDICSTCAAGKYKDSIGSASCTDCGAGKYKDALGSASCTDCGAGKYLATTGAIAASSCVDCGAGTYSATLAASAVGSCLGCPENSHSPPGSTAIGACVLFPRWSTSEYSGSGRGVRKFLECSTFLEWVLVLLAAPIANTLIVSLSA